MQTEISFKNDQKKPDQSLRRAASKTARKFTKFFTWDDLKTLPDAIYIGIDWLSFNCEAQIAEPDDKTIVKRFGDRLVLEYMLMGTPAYKYNYNLILDGEHVGQIQTHGRVVKAGIVKIELQNHLFYDGRWYQIISDIMDCLHIFAIKNISELHICIDGCNNVWKLLNEYAFARNEYFIKSENRLIGGRRSNAQDKVSIPIGFGKKIIKKGRARFDPKVKDGYTGLYENFKIGTGKKYVTLYNKTTDLLKHPEKEYIRRNWITNGMDVNTVQYRCELRMKSEAVAEIKNVELRRLQDVYYLLSIFKTQTENFFDFTVIDSVETNVSRGMKVDLFNYKQLNIMHLEKNVRPTPPGVYKAQMSIHNTFKDVSRKYITNDEDVIHALKHMTNTIEMYDLHRWFEKKIPQWQERYGLPAGHGTQLNLGESKTDWQYYGK